MAVFTNFEFVQFNDGLIQISLQPPQAIGGWDIMFSVTKRFGGTDYVTEKFVSSGLNGASGITVTNSGQGVFQVQINSSDFSGQDCGNLAYTAERTTSGRVTALSLGYLLLTPN